MFFRTESFQQFLKFYPIVSIIVGINLGLWLLTEFLPIPFFESIRALGVGNNFLIEVNNEYWRVVTAIFFHYGLFHALFNSFSLVLFGPPLERMLGKVKFIILYVGAGVIGNLATFWLGHIFLQHAGASGAVFGIFGAYLFIIFFRKHLIDYQSKQIIVVILVIALIMTFIRPGINEFAHIFGLIGGFALANLLIPEKRNTRWI